MTTSSLADRVRAAVRADPLFYDALRAGIVNYRALARTLPVDGEIETIATALRRFADQLPAPEQSSDPRLRLRRDITVTADGADPGLLTVGSVTLQSVDDGTETALLVTGCQPRWFARALVALDIAEIPIVAAGIEGTDAIIVVAQSDGMAALQTLESTS